MISFLKVNKDTKVNHNQLKIKSYNHLNLLNFKIYEGFISEFIRFKFV